MQRYYYLSAVSGRVRNAFLRQIGLKIKLSTHLILYYVELEKIWIDGYVSSILSFFLVSQ